MESTPLFPSWCVRRHIGDLLPSTDSARCSINAGSPGSSVVNTRHTTVRSVTAFSRSRPNAKATAFARCPEIAEREKYMQPVAHLTQSGVDDAFVTRPYTSPSTSYPMHCRAEFRRTETQARPTSGVGN